MRRRVLRTIGYLGLTGVLLAGATLSCATTESASESTEDVELEAAPSSEEIYPEWFEPAVEGMMADGDVIGYGRAVSSNSEHSQQLAEEHALESLRFHIDRFLEAESSSLISSWNGSDSLTGSLRAAVSSLDLSGVSLRSSELNGVGGVDEAVVHVVEARISAEEVGAQLQHSLESLPVQALFQQRTE